MASLYIWHNSEKGNSKCFPGIEIHKCETLRLHLKHNKSEKQQVIKS